MDDPAAFRSPARAVPAEAAEGLAELRRTWLDVAAETLPGDQALVRLLIEGLDAAVAAGWPPAEAEMLTVTEQASQHAVETGSTHAARGLSKRLRRAIYEFLLSLDAASSVEQLSHTASARPAAVGDTGSASAGAGARGGDRPELVWDEPELRVLDGGVSTPLTDVAPPVIVPPPSLEEADGGAEGSTPEPGAARTGEDAEEHSFGGHGWGVRSGARRRRGPDGGRMRGGWLSRLGSPDDEDGSGDEAPVGPTDETGPPHTAERPPVPASPVPAHVPGQHSAPDPVEVELVEVPLDPPGLELVEVPLAPEPAPAGGQAAAPSAGEAEAAAQAQAPSAPGVDDAGHDHGDDLAALAGGDRGAEDQEAMVVAADLDLWPTIRPSQSGGAGDPEAAAPLPAGAEVTAAAEPREAPDALAAAEGVDPADETGSPVDEAAAAELAAEATGGAEGEVGAGEDQAATPPAAGAEPDSPALVVVEVALDPPAAPDDRSRVPEIFRRDQPASPLVVPSYRAWADVLAAGGESPADVEVASPRRSAAGTPPAAPRQPGLHQRPLPTGGLAARLRNARPHATEPVAPAPAAAASEWTPSPGARWTPGDGASAAWPSAGLTPAAALPPFPSGPPTPQARVAPPRPAEPPAPPVLAGDEGAWPAAPFEPAPEPLAAAETWLSSPGGGQSALPVEQRWPGGAAGAAGWPRQPGGEPRHAGASASPTVRPGGGAVAEPPSGEVADDGSWSIRRSPRQQALHERMAQRRREDAIRAATVVFDEHAGRPRKERGPELDRLRLPEQVDTLLRKKRGGEAAALMQRAAQELGGHDVAEQALDCGDRCRALNQSRAAVNSYLAAWRADPLFEAPLWRLAESCLADRENELAVGYLERVADLMRARGDDEGALGVYRKIITVAPERGDVRALLQVAQTWGRIPD